MGFQGLVGIWGVLVTVSALAFSFSWGDWILKRVDFATWAFWMWGLASGVFFLVNGGKRLWSEFQRWRRLRRLERSLEIVCDERKRRWLKKQAEARDAPDSRDAGDDKP